MIYFIDLFCGAGGVTTGVEKARLNGSKIAKVVACVNHDPKAIESHKYNHPEALHFIEDIRTLKLDRLAQMVRQMRANDSSAIVVLWASLECTNFSKAKGGLPRDADSRTLALDMYRYLDELDYPDYFMFENVEEFMSWGPLDQYGKPVSRRNGVDYIKWCNYIQSMGYSYDFKLLNSADFGAFTSRKRLFGIFTRRGLPLSWPQPTHAKNPGKEGMFSGLQKWNAVREKLDLEDHGKSIFGRKKQLSEKTLSRIYAGLIKYVAGGKDQFLLKYNSVNGESGKHNPPSIESPSPVISTQGRLGLISTHFISKYFSGRPEGKSIPIEGPAGTIKCIDSQALISCQYLTNYHGKFEDSKALDTPAGTITTKDRCNLITAQFINRDFTNGGESSGLDKPAGSVMPNPKLNLVTAVPFLVDQSFGNNSRGIDRPAPTILACRKNHFLVNPQWSLNSGSSIDVPAPVLIARQDKSPLILTTTLGGFFIPVHESDSEMAIKIKEFMMIYGIEDILMRMLKIPELIKIQGFPENYKLMGTQADQKKFIGNSVVPLVAQKIIESIASKLFASKQAVP